MAHTTFSIITSVVIVLNCVTLIMDDKASQDQPPAILNISEYFFAIAYTIEALLKILGMGFVLNKDAYLRDPWNAIDLFIIITSYLSLMLSTVNFNALRTIRILRPLRTINVVKNLRALIRTILGRTSLS